MAKYGIDALNKIYNEAEYQREYAKKNYKHYHLKINNQEKRVIKKLEAQENKNRYIIDLIKRDIGESKNESKTKKTAK